MKRRPTRSTRTDTLFPYTTLFRSDAGGAQKKKLLDPKTAGRLNDVELDRQVVVQEACGRTGVGMNATDLRRSQKYRLRKAFPDPFLDGVLPCQVQFIAGRSKDGAEIGRAEGWERVG